MRPCSFLRLTLICVVAITASPALAQKFDLSAFVGGIPSVGDTKVFSISTGGVLVTTVIELQFVGKGWRYVTRSDETGKPPAFVEQFVVPGKQILLGDVESGPLSILVTKPKRFASFVFQLGKWQRASIKGFAFDGANLVGRAVWLRETAFQGLESRDTGIGLFAQTARMETLAGLAVATFSGDRIVSVATVTEWHAPGFGTVASQRRVVAYLNGFQQSDTGTEYLELTSALIGGVTYP